MCGWIAPPRPRRRQAVHRQKRAPSELALRLSSPCTSPLLLCTPRPFVSAFPRHRPLYQAPDAASELSGLLLNSTLHRPYVNRVRAPRSPRNCRKMRTSSAAHRGRRGRTRTSGSKGSRKGRHRRGGGTHNRAPVLESGRPDLAAGGVNSVGRVLASQAGCRGFESRTPLHFLSTSSCCGSVTHEGILWRSREVA